MTYSGPDDQGPQQYPQYGQPGPYQQQYPSAPPPGQPGPYQQQYPSAPPPGYGGYPQPRGVNGLAIAALVCGIIGLFFLSIILGPLALIFGIIALRRANAGASGRGMAIAGIVLGAVDIVLYVIALAYLSSHGWVI